jgi:hypothetical protein
VLWLILAICVLPVVASTALYLFWRPTSFVNHGELLDPVPLADMSFSGADGSGFSFNELQGQWSFVTVDKGGCDAYCERKLYLMRQIRLTQGKHSDRVERVWLVEDGVAPASELVNQNGGMKVFRLGNAAELAVFSAAGDYREYIYVVDPVANLMMRYDRDVDPSKMKKDVSKLLRLSSGWRRLER